MLDFENLQKYRENNRIEAKQALGGLPESIWETYSAFANTDGGKIYIGINDDGSVQGIENPDRTMLRITNMIRDVVRPDVTMFTECATERIDGKTVYDNSPQYMRSALEESLKRLNTDYIDVYVVIADFSICNVVKPVYKVCDSGFTCTC